MAYEKKPNGSRKLITKNEYKKTVSGKERYEAYLERDRKLAALENGELDETDAQTESDADEGAEKKPVSGRARYAAYLEKERKRSEELEQSSQEEPNRPEAAAIPIAAQSDDAEAVADNEQSEENEKKPEKKRASTGESASSGSDENMLRRAFLRRFICSAVLAAAAIALQFAKFHIPLTPSIFAIDFSALPEMLAAVAYGPIVGVAIVLVKNVVYMLVQHTAYVSALSNILLDSLFVFAAGFLYSRGFFTKKSSAGQSAQEKKRNINSARRRNILVSGVASGAVTSVIGYFVTSYISFPLLFRRTPMVDNTERLMGMYQYSLDRINSHLPGFLANRITEIHSIAQGTWMFYVDITFAKLVLVTIVLTILYPMLSDFLHYRK